MKTVFDKPNEQCQARLDIAVARKRGLKAKIFNLFSASLSKVHWTFFISAMVCALGMMTACKNESDTHTIILKTEEPSLTVVDIGDGSNFYCEPISIGGDEHYVIHSTMACPKINVPHNAERRSYWCWCTNGGFSNDFESHFHYEKFY